MLDYVPNPFVIPIGLIIGVLVAAPVGPVNILCIQRVLERGVVAGVVAGSGAVLGDALIALSASLGVGAISGAVQTHRYTIQVVGGLALMIFGARLCTKTPEVLGQSSDGSANGSGANLWDIAKTFLLTVTNPGAVLGLFAIFGGIGSFVELRGYIDALVLVGAIAGGSFAWWLFLSLLISQFRHRFDGSSLKTINMIAGLLLIAFGVMLIGEVAYQKLWLGGWTLGS